MKVEDNARLWIGTKFQHQGRKRGIVCDCVGLILGIASELNIRAKCSGGKSKIFVPSWNHM